jgi:hypothetical protein
MGMHRRLCPAHAGKTKEGGSLTINYSQLSDNSVIIINVPLKGGTIIMKKITKVLLSSVLLLAAGCGAKKEDTPAGPDTAKSEGVMTYAEYAAAELNSEVTIEAYVQGKQSWWDNTATVYTQDADGAYFIYGMACSEADYEKLVTGQKIKVKGYKSEWSGEIEITDATFELEDGNWVATAVDVTDLLGKDELIDHQNQLVSFKDMTVEAKKDDNGNDVAFMYNWDGSGTQGDDLYFDVSKDGKTYTFTVEAYLCDSSTDVYKAVEGLAVGDKVDLEGFLYWYEGVNPHITKVTKK